jgi:hypothetical protein
MQQMYTQFQQMCVMRTNRIARVELHACVRVCVRTRK